MSMPRLGTGASSVDGLRWVRLMNSTRRAAVGGMAVPDVVADEVMTDLLTGGRKRTRRRAPDADGRPEVDAAQPHRIRWVALIGVAFRAGHADARGAVDQVAASFDFAGPSMTISSLSGNAELLAFLNNFRWFALMCVLCIAAALFFKKSQARGPVAVH